MKKLLAMGLACAVMFAPAFSVNAAEEVATCHIGGCNLGECFMDTDGDGICGNHYFVDENDDGICDFHCYADVNADGICDYFVDADEDGICDHCHDHVRALRIIKNITNNIHDAHGYDVCRHDIHNNNWNHT